MKHSLKNQCDLVYIQQKNNDNEDNNQYNSKKGLNSKTKNNKKKDNNINNKDIELIELGEDDLTKKYNMFNIIDKSRNKSSNLNDSLTSNDENDIDIMNNNEKMSDKELAAFRKKNNIVIPSKNNFDMVNSLFNYNKNTNFKIFDYTKVLPEILSIQCAFRSYQARQKHLLLKYLISRITLIQKMIRGIITRQKFKRLKKCLDLIIRIQSNFRRKMYFTVLKVILIQKWIRKYFVRKKYLRKKQRKENSLINPDDEYYDSSDKEEMRKVIQRKKKREKEKKKENQKKLLENERKKKLNEEAKLYKEKENKKKKLAEKQKKLAMNVKQNLKDSKNQANMFYSFFSDLEQNNNMDKSSSTNNKNISYGIPNKKKIKEENYDIENEKDIDKVIAALLLDKKLMRDNESMNRLLANENGVKKDIRYKLLQLDNPLSKFKKENSNKIITNSNKSSYSNIDVLNNKNKSKEKKVKRIEDKLLDYGKALKQKKAQERVDKLKAEDEQCTFKPNLKKKIL